MSRLFVYTDKQGVGIVGKCVLERCGMLEGVHWDDTIVICQNNTK